MKIDCISDLHGHQPVLPGGDLLVVAGDLTAKDTEREYILFYYWISQQAYRKKIVIAGNHDNGMINQIPHKGLDPINPNYEWLEYLCDSGTEFEGLKIWGSPWTKKFEGMNPKCMAFTVDTEEELAKKWALIPDDTDILITHCPPYGILDGFRKYNFIKKGVIETHYGSKSLQMELFNRLHPKLFVCGHIHEGYGVELPGGIVERAVNASHVNELYDPVNEPIRIEL